MNKHGKKVIYERGKDQFILYEGEESEVEWIIFYITTTTKYPLNMRSSSIPAQVFNKFNNFVLTTNRPTTSLHKSSMDQSEGRTSESKRYSS